MTTIALADDHNLIRTALIELINRFPGFTVAFDAPNGKEFVEKFKTNPQPNIALIDINMPIMNGFNTCEYIQEHFPNVIPIALSVDDNEESIIKMLTSGAKGYLLKDTDTADFQYALEQVRDRGFYHSDLVSNTLLKSIYRKNGVAPKISIQFQAREQEFLQLAASELTYKEIADRMCISARTVDGYRESLFEKMEVKSRVGLVLFALKNQMLSLK